MNYDFDRRPWRRSPADQASFSCQAQLCDRRDMRQRSGVNSILCVSEYASSPDRLTARTAITNEVEVRVIHLYCLSKGDDQSHMKPPAELLVAELDSTLAKASGSKSAAILRAMLELFVSGAPTFSSEQVAIFDHLFVRLSENLDKTALLELSATLAPIANAPPKVVDQLSRSDDIAISGPLLGRSERLSEATLCEIARTKGQLHLSAIAARPQITETVSDILLDRGDPEIVHKIAVNPEARLSMRGFSKLIKRAENDRALAATLARRADLPDELQPFLRLALA